MEKKILLFLVLAFATLTGKDYPKPFPGYFSQKGQDKFLNEELFKEKHSGFFIDVGAHDGVSFSNTYFFEKHLGWKGICIEPNPDIFPQLTKNRNCVCLPCGIANQHGIIKFLKCSSYMLEMYSGILDFMDQRHKDRIESEMKEFGGSTTLIDIESKPLRSILAEHNIKHIDFMSMDIEGGEEEAIKSIDFDAVTIDIIVIENNFDSNVVREYLASKGYEYIKRLGKDDIFKHKEFKS